MCTHSINEKHPFACRLAGFQQFYWNTTWSWEKWLCGHTEKRKLNGLAEHDLSVYLKIWPFSPSLSLSISLSLSLWLSIIFYGGWHRGSAEGSAASPNQLITAPHPLWASWLIIMRWYGSDGMCVRVDMCVHMCVSAATRPLHML